MKEVRMLRNRALAFALRLLSYRKWSVRLTVRLAAPPPQLPKHGAETRHKWIDGLHTSGAIAKAKDDLMNELISILHDAAWQAKTLEIVKADPRYESVRMMAERTLTETLDRLRATRERYHAPDE
jgi:hypothetical protein